MAASDVPVWKRSSPLTPKRMVDITKSDSTTYSPPLDGFMVAVAGNVAAIMSGDTAAVTLPVLAGVQYSGSFSKIMSTNTTATGIVGFYLN